MLGKIHFEITSAKSYGGVDNFLYWCEKRNVHPVSLSCSISSSAVVKKRRNKSIHEGMGT